VYPFESIQQTKGMAPTQGYNGPPPVEVVKYVTICNKTACFPPLGGGENGSNQNRMTMSIPPRGGGFD